MNKLDNLPQHLARRPDGQSVVASTVEDVGTAGKPNGSGAFGSLLDGLTQAGQKPNERQGAVPLLRLDSGINKADGALEGMRSRRTDDHPSLLQGSDADDSVDDLLTSLLLDKAGDQTSPGQGGAAPPSAVCTVLEGLLPRVLNQGTDGLERSAVNTLRPGIQLPSDMSDQGGLLSSTSGSTLKLTVRLQETHFKPIMEGFSTKLVMPGREETEPIERAADLGSSGEMFELTSKGPAKKPLLVSRAAAEADVPRNVAASKSEAPGSLPHAMLQKIAGSIIDEVKPLTSTPASSSPGAADGAILLSTARASDGVVRMLNIQLHPADLGLVTIKMKLSGDTLEMEVQVSSEETAQMLKHDSEKLSSLLRGSGYRPEIINIHAGPVDATQQSSMQTQRQQTLGPSQQEAFQQGAGSHGDRSHGHGQDYENERKGNRDSETSEADSGNRSVGGVYL
ncbi:flagellar hook-length control protein FliK [Microvirga sp. 2TAF3]|uniref:flagellar hook-length control protein FliK n=1 Tax=Microvirga sp. 2TAF3 TaxID=3233014 RepID=UPI003F9DBF63